MVLVFSKREKSGYQKILVKPIFFGNPVVYVVLNLSCFRIWIIIMVHANFPDRSDPFLCLPFWQSSMGVLCSIQKTFALQVNRWFTELRTWDYHGYQHSAKNLGHAVLYGRNVYQTVFILGRFGNVFQNNESWHQSWWLTAYVALNPVQFGTAPGRYANLAWPVQWKIRLEDRPNQSSWTPTLLCPGFHPWTVLQNLSTSRNSWFAK